MKSDVVRGIQRREGAIDIFLRCHGNITMKELACKVGVVEHRANQYIDYYFKNKALYRRKVERYSKNGINTHIKKDN